MSAPAVSISGVLRVAVLASSPAEQGRLAALVGQCGHRIVGPGASPDAVLTDGTAAATLPAAAVAIGAVNEAFAGLLPPDAAAAQVDAALRAVAAGLIVRTPALPPRTFEWLPEEPPILLTPREIEVLGALRNGLTNKETARLLGIFAAYRQVPHRSAVPKARRRVSGRSRCQGASSRSSNSKSRVPNRDGSRLLRRAGLLGERRHSTKGQSRTSPQAWPCRRRTPVAMARRRPE